jgi:16S rRNA (guanine1516-N2)-methyltransferase
VTLALALTHKKRPGRDLLVRALGPRVRTVIDATAGLGRDASALACAGYTVTALERAPALVALWQRAVADAALPAKLTFVAADAIAHLAHLAEDARPDAVYLDPMYDAGPRTAQPKRAMIDVRAAVGDDPDVDALFAAARAAARLRVVVKRPKRAPPLGANVSHALVGASTRFDVYAIGAG